MPAASSSASCAARLAGGVARAGEEVREERARLREREAGADAGAPGLPRRGDDARGRAVALADGDGLVGERRLPAQPRGEGEERHDEAGEAHDERKFLCFEEFRISSKVNTPGNRHSASSPAAAANAAFPFFSF